MKKVVALVLALVLVLGLAACGTNGGNTTPANNTANTNTTPANNGGNNAEPAKVEWPGKEPVNVYVPGKAGGPTDTAARIIVDYLAKTTGGTFAVMNDDTGGGVGVCESIRNAKDPAHNLAIMGPQNITAVIGGTYSHDLRDTSKFTIIDRVITGAHSNFFVMSKDAPFQDYDGFIKYAKENPGKVRVCQQTGSLSSLYVGILIEKEGLDVKLLEASTNEAETNLLGNLADVAVLSFTKVDGYKEDGRILPMLYIDPERDTVYKDIKCFGDIGLGDKIAHGGQILASGAGLDPAIIAYINEIIAGIVNDADSVKRAETSANVLDPLGQAAAIEAYQKSFEMYESASK